MQEINELLSNESFTHAKTLAGLLKGFINKYDVNINLTDLAGISKLDSQLDDIFQLYSYHNNAFCNYVKKHSDSFYLCINSKGRLIQGLEKKTTPFFGRCYMGVYELNYAAWHNERPIALICLGQFSLDMASSLDFVWRKAKKHGLNPQACVREFSKVTKAINFSISDLNKDVWVICNFLSLLYSNGIHQASMNSEQMKALASSTDYYQEKHLVSSARQFIRQNFKNKISLDLIARHCYCNPTYLSHIFNKETGTTIPDYINNYRVEHAKHLLDVSTLTITQISSQVGFNDASYFSKTFKKIQGMYPSHYRKRSIAKDNP